jgi:hypothetical protein
MFTFGGRIGLMYQEDRQRDMERMYRQQGQDQQRPFSGGDPYAGQQFPYGMPPMMMGMPPMPPMSPYGVRPSSRM